MTTTSTQTTIRTVLHVGCGDKNPATLHPVFRGAEWQEIRLDIDPSVQPDIVSTITNMPMVASNSMDAVWSSHNVEHLYAHEVPLAFAEFYRVLKPGGSLLITLPDLQKVAELIAADKLDEPAYVAPAGPISPLDMVYGYRPSIARGNIYMAHRTGFTAKTLGSTLLKAGFKSDLRLDRDGFDLWALARK